jgi:hypothetical protein
MARDDAYLVDLLDAARLALVYVSDKTKKSSTMTSSVRTP